MATAEQRSDSWRTFVDSLDAVERALNRVVAVNVNASGPRDSTKGLIQHYFRETRPDLLSLEVAPDQLETMDELMQSFLQLANGRNAKTSYTRVLRAVRTETQRLELVREYRLGEQRRTNEPRSGLVIADVEVKILETLRDLVPTAALSYEQAIRDLSATDRISYRGTANELREALRETVDRLAPDDQVTASAGFRLEAGRTGPTQKQKVRHILRSRRLSATARTTPENSVELVEALTGSVARASYERSSLSAHVASTEREVRQMKMYVDSVLAELLQVHG